MNQPVSLPKLEGVTLTYILVGRRASGLTLPFRHRFQIIGRSRDLEGALVAVPGELVDRHRDLVAADAEDAAGIDHEPLDRLALGVHEDGRDGTDLAVVASIDGGPADLGDILHLQRIRCGRPGDGRGERNGSVRIGSPAGRTW